MLPCIMDIPVIKTKLGELRGRISTDYLEGRYYSFQGIPYAKAPIGELRFKAPQPIEPWTGVLDATKEGPECPSHHLLFQYYVGDEDNCLNLSIYIKEMPKVDGSLKPVMVWIFGGGFIQGSNKTEMYGPEYLITEDVILVMINYRIGVFGFLCLEDNSCNVYGNAGLKDQVMALKWVRDNIASFGGDPNNVTIYGESAGGASVHYHILSPTSKGLFHKAIMQSGCVLNAWAQGRRGAEDLVKRLKIEAGDEHQLLSKLQKLPAKTLVTAQMEAPELVAAGQNRPYGPVIENQSTEAFLTEDPLSIMKSGNYNKVPTIVGMMTNEGLLFELVKGIRKVLWPLKFEMEIPHELKVPPGSEMSTKLAERIRQFYQYDETLSHTEKHAVALRMKSDNLFNHGLHRTVKYHTEYNMNPIYYYVFSFEGQLNHFKKTACSNSLIFYAVCQFLKTYFSNTMLKQMFGKLSNSIGFTKTQGCSHGDDLGYLFKSILSDEVDLQSREAKTIKRVVKLWTNFAKYGNPTPQSQDNELEVVWKPVEKGAHHYLNIGDELKMKMNPFPERNEFWDAIYLEYCENLAVK